MQLLGHVSHPGLIRPCPPNAHSARRAFWWLPLYNFLVMLVTLAYQAPFEDILDWQIDPDQKASGLVIEWFLNAGHASPRSILKSNLGLDNLLKLQQT